MGNWLKPLFGWDKKRWAGSPAGSQHQPNVGDASSPASPAFFIPGALFAPPVAEIPHPAQPSVADRRPLSPPELPLADRRRASSRRQPLPSPDPIPTAASPRRLRLDSRHPPRLRPPLPASCRASPTSGTLAATTHRPYPRRPEAAPHPSPPRPTAPPCACEPRCDGGGRVVSLPPPTAGESRRGSSPVALILL